MPLRRPSPLRRLRHSLLARLLTGSVLVALCSITATAWLAAQSTAGSIRHEQVEALAGDQSINDTLLGYAATHPTWAGVAPTVRDLARRTGRRIALTTESGVPIADSARSGTPLPPRASAAVDPLAVDVTLAPGATSERIDPRAVAPFGLPAEIRERLRRSAEASSDCLRRAGHEVRISTGLSGRPSVRIVRPDGSATDPGPWPSDMLISPPPEPPVLSESPEDCRPEPMRLTPSEAAALDWLNRKVGDCVFPQMPERLRRILIAVDINGTWQIRHPTRFGDHKTISDCLTAARREQLRPHVAPAALLYIGNPSDEVRPQAGLTTAGLTRIAGAAAAVLVLTVGVSVVISTRLMRPVRALTAAVRQMRAGDGPSRVRVKDDGELGRLAAAFNEMSEHLERMEAQRKEMVSDVSHELRTPLSNVRGWLEAAYDGVAELDPELITSLIEEILLLQHIVDDLQQLALADAGKLPLHPRTVDVAELLDQVATVHRGRAELARIALTAEVSEGLRLQADPVRLRQALGNLVTNALRHTPPGGRVFLRGRRRGDRILVEVGDTGPGIDPEVLPHVFDRFWRADKSRSRRTGGSGLGLAIVRSLAEAHGGLATVASEPGAGTTFTLHLPG